MTDRTQLSLLAMAMSIVCACNIDPRDDDAPEGGSSDADGNSDTNPTSASATATASASASDSGATTSTAGTGDETSGDTPLLDVGTDEDPVIPDEACIEIAMTASNQGCEFWAVDLPNVWTDGNELGAEDHQFAVVIANTGGQMADVRVYLGDAATSTDSAMVPAGQTHEFLLPAANIENRANTTDGLAYRIESSHPLTAYQFNPLDNDVEVYSNDASLLFPTHVLGDDYTAITGDSVTLATNTIVDNAGAFISAVATEDDTNIQLFATNELYQGAVTVNIDRGQVATWISDEPPPFPPQPQGVPGAGNLSGSRISSTKPIAVFSGNVATIEPNPGDCCADHMEHQMLPLVAWGASYVTAPAPAPDDPTGVGDPVGYRITGAFNGTNLSYDPSAPQGAPTTIDAGETVRFESDRGFVVTSDDENKPFAVTQFLQSSQWLARMGFMGDPAMIAIPATAQFQSRYIISVPTGYTANYVTIYRPVGTDIAVDDALPNVVFWSPIGALDGTDWEYAHISVSPGSHTIEAMPDDSTIAIISSGYSDYVSYGYPGGSGIEIISDPPPPAG